MCLDRRCGHTYLISETAAASSVTLACRNCHCCRRFLKIVKSLSATLQLRYSNCVQSATTNFFSLLLYNRYEKLRLTSQCFHNISSLDGCQDHSASKPDLCISVALQPLGVFPVTWRPLSARRLLCFLVQGWRNDFRGGGSRFQGAQGDPL